ncbi:uncharacterized protein BYT42DRAFT_558858 [Radiomyces spectabilis]|uniref:uncharacterized protein n=1 Tax=Radiomyces spectabilis TaxID=64574 RepID=UPI00221FB8A0|nr:uncharacterized protein BYT42DRAFT_558858 [Radiomyces spectabilis]KAI8388074.1 hypothetical protein BYT42DRAFT_558858 [Radiomyces spectabilis]
MGKYAFTLFVVATTLMAVPLTLAQPSPPNLWSECSPVPMECEGEKIACYAPSEEIAIRRCPPMCGRFGAACPEGIKTCCWD